MSILDRHAEFEVVALEGGIKAIRFAGAWTNAAIAAMDKAIRDLENKGLPGTLLIDLGAVEHLDTGGAWLIRRLKTSLEKDRESIRIVNATPAMLELIEALPARLPEPRVVPPAQTSLFEKIFAPVGEQAERIWVDGVRALYILGSGVRGTQMKLGRGSGLSPAAIVTQLEHMGVRAVPIIVLMSFLIGAIIAQQGAFQLRYFGAELFVVDLVGILQLREIGVLLTAIMVAGRSGSAITAEIGSMKMQEEIDALKVMGLNPIGVLIFPRLISLVIILPCLTVVANFSALAGAAVVANFYSDITFTVFLDRLRTAIDMSTVVSGMLKAPFMALIIGIVASVEGLKVGGSAESLGRNVTASVVKAIFVVILVDGLFAMFYASIDF
jgi:phospholipid/cholesterol/gamma-HCH transport system permease protein